MQLWALAAAKKKTKKNYSPQTLLSLLFAPYGPTYSPLRPAPYGQRPTAPRPYQGPELHRNATSAEMS